MFVTSVGFVMMSLLEMDPKHGATYSLWCSCAHTEAMLALRKEANMFAKPHAGIRGGNVGHGFSVNELTTLNNKSPQQIYRLVDIEGLVRLPAV